jgi:hypothetical protein
VRALPACVGHRRIETLLRHRPERGLPAPPQYPDGEHYREIAGKLRENCTAMSFPPLPGESCFTSQRITSEGAITSTAGRTNGRLGVVWKERLAVARNAAATGAVRAPARVLCRRSDGWEKTGHSYPRLLSRAGRAAAGVKGINM